jgi:ABC-type Fe3+ transport system permease subunit
VHLNGAIAWTRAHRLGLFGGAVFEVHDAWPVRPVAEVFVEAERDVPTAVSGLVGAIRRVRDGAVTSASAFLVVALFIGHAAARGRRGGVGLDAVGVLAFVMPASVLGVGIIAAWNRPWLQAVYGSSAIVALAFVARYSAIGLRVAAVSFAQGSEHLEEAAAMTGAGFLWQLGRILLPVHARGIAAAWLIALVFCLRDLETAVLLYPAGPGTAHGAHLTTAVLDEGRVVHVGQLDALNSRRDLPFARQILDALA